MSTSAPAEKALFAPADAGRARAMVGSALLFGMLEGWHYYNWLGLDRRLVDPFWDRTIVFFMAVIKTLALGFVLWLVAAMTQRAGQPGWARRLFAGGYAALFVWLTLDLIAHHLTGNHLAYYIPFLPVIFASQDGAGLEMVGGLRAISMVVLVGVLPVLGVTFLLDRFRARLESSMHLPEAGAYLLLILLGTLAQMSFSDRNLASRVHDGMPVSLDFTATLADGLGDIVDPDRLRLVGLRPQPRSPAPEEVVLQNPTSAIVSLQGWSLTNRAGQRFELQGDIGPGKSKTLPLKDFRLDDKGDAISLLDPEGAVEDWVQYLHIHVEQDRVISYADHLDGDPILSQLQDRVEPDLQRLRLAMTQAQPVDERYRLPADGSKPHVLLVIVESLRSEAIEPVAAPRLSAWAQGGTRWLRHYSPNASHLGVFSLLFGRVPITYLRDTTMWVPPQSTQTLRAAGYKTHFFTSAPYQGYFGMDRFIIEQNFDTIYAPSAQDSEFSGDLEWKQWPDKDRFILEQARQLLRSDQPQFVVCFLKATHFPYPYPAEHEKFVPAGPRELENTHWASLGEEKLRNRYRNSVSFLDTSIMDVVDGLDPAKNIVIVTGDHGESFWDDGTLGHGSRSSEVQCRTALAAVGPGISAGEITTATAHQDLVPTLFHWISGTSVELTNCHGRDLLASEVNVDETMFSTNRFFSPWELVVVSGQRKMQVDIVFNRGIKVDPTGCRLAGFQGRNGDLESQSPPETELPGLEQALREQMSKLNLAPRLHGEGGPAGHR